MLNDVNPQIQGGPRGTQGAAKDFHYSYQQDRELADAWKQNKASIGTDIQQTADLILNQLTKALLSLKGQELILMWESLYSDIWFGTLWLKWKHISVRWMKSVFSNPCLPATLHTVHQFTLMIFACVEARDVFGDANLWYTKWKQDKSFNFCCQKNFVKQS